MANEQLHLVDEQPLSAHEQRLFYRIALTQVKGIGQVLGRQLLEIFGDAESVFKEIPHLRQRIRGVNTTLLNAFQQPEPLRLAEKELTFISKHHILPLFINDEGYPDKLRELTDAPLMLYYKGNADLLRERMYSVVGTRQPSPYGEESTRDFVRSIAQEADRPTVVSGLAYGVDVIAHREALLCGSPTVAVLAHGLDRIYPAAHRHTAAEILHQGGGLLTEFPSGTTPERYNFVARNRIVALLSRCVLVMESAAKGGSLITARIAHSYGREVFALPGRTTDLYSAGCLSLIERQQAQLLRSPAQFLQEVGWTIGQTATLFPKTETPSPKRFPAEHRPLLTLLQQSGPLHINELSVQVDIPIGKLSAQLLELEFQGWVKPLPGGCYELVASSCS